MRLTLAASALALTGLATGCADISADPASEPSDSTTAVTDGKPLPSCADLWQVGETLPKDYDGCQDGEQVFRAGFLACPDSDRRYASYQDKAYAVPGSEIVTDDDPEVICAA